MLSSAALCSCTVQIRQLHSKRSQGTFVLVGIVAFQEFDMDNIRSRHKYADKQFTFRDDLARLSVVTPATYPLLGFGATVQGKFVTFGVTRGWIAVASPLSSITWLISP
jgi:hypothetical protein